MSSETGHEGLFLSGPRLSSVARNEVTLHRWLAAEKIQPFGIELGDGRKLWRWNDRDIAEGRKLKALRKRGPKTKR